jgi:hypothetical protein
VPSSSIARINLACGNAATLIWNVGRKMLPNDSLTCRIFSPTGFRVADEQRSSGPEQRNESCQTWFTRKIMFA